MTLATSAAGAREPAFRLEGALRLTGIAGIDRGLESLLERVSGLRRLQDRYEREPNGLAEREFIDRVLQILRIRIQLPEHELQNIPRTGPLVIVANHPFGGIEGVILAKLITGLRPDTKIMANRLLQRIPELRERFLAVDPFGGSRAVRNNHRPLREAANWLREGKCLVVFPAGEVSHPQVTLRRIADPSWSTSVARLIQISRAAVTPVFFHGRNSWLFQIVGFVHPRLRTLLLPRELWNKKGRTISLRIGTPIAHAKLRNMGGREELTRYLRLHTYMLAKSTAPKTETQRVASGTEVAVATAPDIGVVGAEVGALPARQCLVESGSNAVYFARSQQIPWLLQEIGRQREITFRATGEGTGKATDIDIYDAYYLHLFVWNREKRELVGAYRLGLSDEIVARYGKKGLYTHSLFKYKTRVLNEIDPAIELGRSFVRQEYQRSYAPLMLLWRGIGAFIVQHPRYRVLFGPVSISREYATASQQLLVDFLRVNSLERPLARHVRPRRPFRHSQPRSWHPSDIHGLGDIDGLSELIMRLEPDAKGVPILLKQYLKLGGRILGFNVDPAFSDVLDALIRVDLTKADPKVLSRYMDAEGAARFLRFHGRPELHKAS